MFEYIDRYLNITWMSELLLFNDLNALSLTSKTLSSFSNEARMLKVKKWTETSNEGEKVWIKHYKENFPKIINPASLYLKCLRYRHISKEHFRDIVRRDPRLTRRQQFELLQLPLDTQPCPLFYWFVVDLLPQRPLKINFSLDLLRDVLQLPYGQEIIRNTSLGRVFVCLNNRRDIVISNDDALLGIVTKDNHLWMTGLWNEQHSTFLNKICSMSPEVIITMFSRTCPFCGMDISQECSHTMTCMSNYAQWVGGRKKFNSIFKKMI